MVFADHKQLSIKKQTDISVIKGMPSLQYSIRKQCTKSRARMAQQTPHILEKDLSCNWPIEINLAWPAIS